MLTINRRLHFSTVRSQLWRQGCGAIGALLIAGCGVNAMSPVLPEPDAIAGHWVVAEEGSGTACPIDFTLAAAGNAHVAVGEPRCFAALGLSGVTAWRPASDGIALASADGMTVGFFSKDRGGVHLLRRNGRADLVLRRADSRR